MLDELAEIVSQDLCETQHKTCTTSHSNVWKCYFQHFFAGNCCKTSILYSGSMKLYLPKGPNSPSVCYIKL